MSQPPPLLKHPSTIALNAYLSRVDAKSPISIRNLPTSFHGLGLGLYGLAGLIETVADVHSVLVPEIVVIPLLILSFLMIAMNIAKCCWAPRVAWTELSSYNTSFAYAAGMIHINLLGKWATEDPRFSTLGVVMIWVGTILQLICTPVFLVQAWRGKHSPEPLWNPPVVSIALLAWTGADVGLPFALVFFGFWAGIAACMFTVPIQAYRSLQSPHTVAPDASVNMLQAPLSFMTLAWHSLNEDVQISLVGSRLAPFGMDILFSCASFMALVTLICLIQRRKAVRDTLFCQRWAALTFPTMSTCIATNRYFQRYSAASSVSSTGIVTFKYWAVFITIVGASIVISVVGSQYYQLRIWLKPLVHVPAPPVLARLQAYTTSSRRGNTMTFPFPSESSLSMSPPNNASLSGWSRKNNSEQYVIIF